MIRLGTKTGPFGSRIIRPATKSTTTAITTSPCLSSLSLSVRYLNNGKPQNPEYNEEVRMKILPIKRTGEDLQTMRARLLYQSRKRGILETDLLLSRFAKRYLQTFDMEQLKEYDQLLDEPDWDIYYWATKNFDVTPLPEKWENSKVLGMLQEDAKNKEREILRMPDL